MPPKKRSSARRAGAVSLASKTHESPSYLPGASSSAPKNPALPDIPVKHSFEYGASSTPLLPRKLAAHGQLNLVEVAEKIDDGIKEAQVRETSNKPQSNTRARKDPTPVQSPRRRSRREPTPDELQLIDSLRDATVSPPPLDLENQSHQPSQSTPTPTPPIPHTLSTTSSPAPYTLQADQLYPSPLLRLGSPNREMSFSSPQFKDAVETESLISWAVERDIHGDDLQRTHGSRFRDEPQGKNITAPPRRFSGLAFKQDTIEEEEEPASVSPVPKSPSPLPTPKSQPKVAAEPEPQPEPRIQSPSASPPRSQSDAQSEPMQPAISSAPAKTVISYRHVPESSIRQASPPLRRRSKSSASKIASFTMPSQPNFFIRAAKVLLIAVMTCVTMYTWGDNILDFSSTIGSRLRWGSEISHLDLNATAIEAVNVLSHQVHRLGLQVSSLSRDIKTMKSDISDLAAAPTGVVPKPVSAPETAKVNFLSVGMGALVDPWRTSPAVGRKLNKLEKMFDWAGALPNAKPLAPIAALVGWEEVGDCWCSSQKTGLSQIGVLLGRYIVPEEVVVEHISKGATVRPEYAPQDMEMWAEYTLVDTDEDTVNDKYPIMRRSKQLPEGFSLHETVMNALRVAYRGEPESAYSNDKYIGPSFYRVGRWKYNIHAPNNIQTFSLDAVLDIPSVRVNHVVFRTKSNWGADETCIYRLRLHGHG